MEPNENAVLVYGERAGQLIFVPTPLAQRLTTLRQAIQSASTWGELKELLPQDNYQEIASMLTEWCELEETFQPEGGEPFEGSKIPGYDDGDWPEWPAQEMLSWMPQELQQSYGTVKDSIFNGEFLEIEAEQKQALVADLEALGYKCVEDDQAIAKAHGDRIPVRSE